MKITPYIIIIKIDLSLTSLLFKLIWDYNGIESEEEPIPKTNYSYHLNELRPTGYSNLSQYQKREMLRMNSDILDDLRGKRSEGHVTTVWENNEMLNKSEIEI